MVSLRSFVAGVALVMAPVVTAITASEVAKGIDDLTKLSLDLQRPANSITIINAPLLVIGQGPFPQIILGFNQIVTTGTSLIQQANDLAPLAGPDADLVYNSYQKFANTHTALINLLISKATILDKVPIVGSPIAAVLRSDESIIDSLSITLINKVDAHATEISAEASTLNEALDLCIQRYTGITEG
ncbi:hypothetical protein C8A05DRAFT_30604 [Staphylotrichum tortipilum]|uniref:Uncharacterized protein n=1 Tax=Staphylotrichum tortipilum TaxID=2831512 RepID=A0AAN6RXA1_9PEZI|nr:hypothetical protein C8A05DRAFT_30604 [Staphylotrichum longicolle]